MIKNFSVAVLTRPYGKNVDELLEPFKKGLIVPRYAISKEEVVAKGRAKIERYRKLVYEKYLANPEVFENFYGPNGKYINYLKYNFPKMLKLTDEEIYRIETKDIPREDIDPDGSVYSIQNPYAKWTSHKLELPFLTLKSGFIAESALIKDVDFSPSKERYKNSLVWWEINIEKRAPLTEYEDKCRTKLTIPEQLYIDCYGTKENYASVHSQFATFAVITPNGNWYEKGDASDYEHLLIDKEALQWETNFYDLFIKQADDDWTITIETCYI